MGLIKQLGYMGLNVVDTDAWHALMTDVLGMQAIGEPGTDVSHLRLDNRHHRMSLYPSGRNSTAYIGWEVADENDLAQAKQTLTSRGIEVSPGTAEQRLDRRVQDLIRFTDLNGIQMEIYHGAQNHDDNRSRGFVTGDLGLGHVVCASADPKASLDFYCQTLDFQVSDTMEAGPMWLAFLRCNPRHHSLGFGSERPGGTRAGHISHLMVEAKEMDDVGKAYDLCLAREIPIWMSLGKHSNDHLTSFYLISPSGFAIEYGYGGRLIDDENWQIEHLDTATIWGHKIITPKPPGDG
jgi:extradiol dioxygenase